MILLEAIGLAMCSATGLWATILSAIYASNNKRGLAAAQLAFSLPSWVPFWALLILLADRWMS